MGYIVERQSPYDQWERYKLPLRAKIALLFLSKDERKKVKNKIDKINRVRRLDLKRKIDEWKKNIRPPRLYPEENIRPSFPDCESVKA